MSKETVYQGRLIQKLERMFPGCLILKNDSGYLQGIPDLLILFRDRWAALEVKISEDANERPNQGYYVSILHAMSYASFVWPEIEEEVLDALSVALKSRR